MTKGLDLTVSFDARCKSNKGCILRLRLENDGVLLLDYLMKFIIIKLGFCLKEVWML